MLDGSSNPNGDLPSYIIGADNPAFQLSIRGEHPSRRGNKALKRSLS